jgi:hypothetical protein
MGYFADCLNYFGLINFVIRWFELIFSVLGLSFKRFILIQKVLVLGGVVPYEKIRDTSNSILTSSYNGIYVTAGATRFTIFAVKAFFWNDFD